MAYSLNSSSDNCYEGTTCLINKFDIRDEEKLAEIEAQITFAKTVMLESTPVDGNFDFVHFKKYTNFYFAICMSGRAKYATWIFQKRERRFLNAIILKTLQQNALRKLMTDILKICL